ncbi:MAG: ATP-binding protein, partial [Luteolibacter sp.]
FHKECLVNISRHSEATECSIDLVATPDQLTLTITDNGCGLPESSSNQAPYSLKRRARLLRAKVRVESHPATGTTIRLSRKNCRWAFLR